MTILYQLNTQRPDYVKLITNTTRGETIFKSVHVLYDRFVFELPQDVAYILKYPRVGLSVFFRHNTNMPINGVCSPQQCKQTQDFRSVR